MRIIKCGLVLVVPLLGLGCSPDIQMDEQPTVSESPIAIFSPDPAVPCNSVLPFPSDLSRNAETGLLDGLPFCEGDSVDTIALKYGLRQADGYSISTAIYTHFSEAYDTETAAANVLVFDEDGAAVQVTTVPLEDGEQLMIIPAAGVLREGTEYSVVVLDGLLTSTGESYVSDQAFSLIKSTDPLIDDLGYSNYAALDDAKAYGLEALRSAWIPLFDDLEDMEISRSDVLVGWRFTTQRVVTALDDLSSVIADRPVQFVQDDVIAAADHPLLEAAGIPRTALCDVYTGRVLMNGLLSDAGLFSNQIREVVADYVFITPADATTGCTEPWNYGKVAIFAHGLGRCKNDVLAAANSLAMAGFAVLSVDGPRAGTRSLESLGDQDLDGCQDQPATPEFLAVGGANPSPFSVRDHLRQWGLELSQIATQAKLEPGQLVGATTDTPALMQVAMLGHSWGGMAAVHAGAINRDIDVLAVTATSGNLAGAFTPLLEAGIRAQLEAQGMDLGSATVQALLAESVATAVAGYRWALEPGDPLYVVGGYPVPEELPVLVQVVSNVGADASLHGTATQEELANAFGRHALASTSFTLGCTDGGTEVPLCDDSTAVVGAPLIPCYTPPIGVDPLTDPTFLAAYAKTQGMQGQLVSFLATNGACLGIFNGMDCLPVPTEMTACP